jgi:hypothetical protein
VSTNVATPEAVKEDPQKRETMALDNAGEVGKLKQRPARRPQLEVNLVLVAFVWFDLV